MPRLVISLVLGALLLVFSAQNLNQVTIRFIFGPEVHLPLIIIVWASVLVGFLVCTLQHLAGAVNGRKKAKKENKEEDDE
ncbi:MAG: hypothetical protein HQK86_02745 [Nitrospinae bacterium]|nr:hypothetical protein [Nitrospinota bacterium]MBF0635118.1 hypothetical protein [Nitrospinota bacterium]